MASREQGTEILNSNEEFLKLPVLISIFFLPVPVRATKSRSLESLVAGGRSKKLGSESETFASKD